MFPPLDATDTVVREGMALVQRYRLMRLLTDSRGVRRDLRGDAPEADLVQQMRRQLVAGVDAPYGRDDVPWPIPPGVRLESLAQSPWLDDVREPMGLYGVPRTAAEFADLFQTKTGVSPYSHAMERNYRITPFELGRVAEQIGGQAEKPTTALLMLCSRQYEAAVSAEAANGKSYLRNIPASANRFLLPAREGFRLLGELERIALTVEDLGVINLLSVSRIRKLLDGPSLAPLNKAFRQHPTLKRLFDYQMIGSDALGGFENAASAGITLSDPNLRAVASAAGGLDVDVVKALTSKTSDGHYARITLRAAFPDRVPDTRESFLANDDPATFYGSNWTLLGALLADLGRQFDHGDQTNATGGDFERHALLAAEILAKVNPRQHQRNTSRTAHLNQASSLKAPSGTNHQCNAMAHSSLMLPALSASGSSPRGRVDRWDSHRWDDLPLWIVMSDRKLGVDPTDLSPGERRIIDGAFSRLNQLFQPTLLASGGLAVRVDREDALRAVCDMATGVSAVSTNRLAGRAIAGWLAAFGSVSKGQSKKHGWRWTAGLAHILKMKSRKSAPPTGNKANGTGRKNRAVTRKLKAAADRIRHGSQRMSAK